MTLIEVLEPEGRMQVYMTEQRNMRDIAQEVAEIYPDATVWRKSKDWRLTGNGRPADGIPAINETLRTVLIVLALALILTPVITWATTYDRLSIFGPSTDIAQQSGQTGASGDEATAAAPTGEVSIIDVETQDSDTSLTLRVHVHNGDAVAHDDIKVSAVFLDSSGAIVPMEEGGSASISLAPGDEGYVKLWAHSESGVAEYELAIAD